MSTGRQAVLAALEAISSPRSEFARSELEALQAVVQAARELPERSVRDRVARKYARSIFSLLDVAEPGKQRSNALIVLGCILENLGNCSQAQKTLRQLVTAADAALRGRVLQ